MLDQNAGGRASRVRSRCARVYAYNFFSRYARASRLLSGGRRVLAARAKGFSRGKRRRRPLFLSFFTARDSFSSFRGCFCRRRRRRRRRFCVLFLIRRRLDFLVHLLCRRLQSLGFFRGKVPLFVRKRAGLPFHFPFRRVESVFDGIW